MIQVFGARNWRMVQDFANLIGNVVPEDIHNLATDEQMLLIEGEPCAVGKRGITRTDDWTLERIEDRLATATPQALRCFFDGRQVCLRCSFS